jgi:hypothetical protein
LWGGGVKLCCCLNLSNHLLDALTFSKPNHRATLATFSYIIEPVLETFTEHGPSNHVLAYLTSTFNFGSKNAVLIFHREHSIKDVAI